MHRRTNIHVAGIVLVWFEWAVAGYVIVLLYTYNYVKYVAFYIMVVVRWISQFNPHFKILTAINDNAVRVVECVCWKSIIDTLCT